MSSREDEATLVARLRIRATDPVTRTDYGSPRPQDLPLPATEAAIRAAESRLGSALYPLHRRLFLEIADGGFGPADGIIGLGPGGLDAHGRSLVELHDALWLDEATAMPGAVVPLCDWGCGTWACLDGNTGRVFMLDEFGATDTGVSLYEYMGDWVHGVSLGEKLFTFVDVSGINPFTRQPVVLRSRSRPTGAAYTIGGAGPKRSD